MFRVILPSNSKGTDAIENKSSHFSTTLESPLELLESENWSVALKELSFIDSILTITDNDYIKIEETKSRDTLKNYKWDKFQPLQNNSNEFQLAPDLKMIFHLDSYSRLFYKFPSNNFKIVFRLSNKWAYLLGFDSYITKETFTGRREIENGYELNGTEFRHQRGQWIYKFKHKYLNRAKYLVELMKMYPNTKLSYPYESDDHLYFKYNIDDNECKAKIDIELTIPIVEPLEKQFKIKPGYYKSGSELLEAFPLTEIKEYGYNILFNEATNRFIIKTDDTKHSLLKLYLNSDLASILGFLKINCFNAKTGSIVATASPNLMRGIQNIFIYCDICEHSIIGNTTAQLLRVVHFKREKYNDNVNIMYDNPSFVPLRKTFINNIEITLADDMGQTIPFEEGKVIVTLEFKSL